MLTWGTTSTGRTLESLTPLERKRTLGSIDWKFWYWYWHPHQDDIRNAVSIATHWYAHDNTVPAYYKVWQRLPWHDDEYHTFTEWTLHSTQEVADLLYDLVAYG